MAMIQALCSVIAAALARRSSSRFRELSMRMIILYMSMVPIEVCPRCNTPIAYAVPMWPGTVHCWRGHEWTEGRGKLWLVSERTAARIPYKGDPVTILDHFYMSLPRPRS